MEAGSKHRNINKGGWPVVPQKVTPNSSPVMCQYKRDWQFNISKVIPEERLKQAYQLVWAIRRGRARVKQTTPSDQAVEEWRRLAKSVNHSLPRYTGVAALKRRTTQKLPPTSTYPSAAAAAGNRRERDGNSKMEVTPTSPPNVYEEEKVLGEDASG